MEEKGGGPELGYVELRAWGPCLCVLPGDPTSLIGADIGLRQSVPIGAERLKSEKKF